MKWTCSGCGTTWAGAFGVCITCARRKRSDALKMIAEWDFKDMEPDGNDAVAMQEIARCALAEERPMSEDG